MKLNCFVLHTNPGFDSLINNINKHKELTLMPVEHDIENLCNRTFPAEFDPHITFIDRTLFQAERKRLYTLIKKSGMVIELGERDILNGDEPLDKDVKFTIPYNENFKEFSIWACIFRHDIARALNSIPDFSKYSVNLSTLKQGQTIEIFTDDIVCVRVDGKTCYIGLKDRTVLCTNTMAELYTIFRNPNFIQASEQDIINMRKMDGIWCDIFRMSNGENILLGPRFRMSFYNIMAPGLLASQSRKARTFKLFNSIDESYIEKWRNADLPADFQYRH